MGRDGRRENFGFIRFQDKVTDGTISQETYEAITKYMEENKPELPTETEDGEREDRKAGEGPDLLTDLLEVGVITQEEYESLSAAVNDAQSSAQTGETAAS